MKRIGILLCCIVLCLLFPEKVHAEEIVSEKEPVDIIFVIDCSGSMKTNDVSRMGLSMVQAFVDTVQAEDIRIGYVAYNDSILSYSAPKSIALAEEREALKEEIGAITYSRDTDIGLGVSYACELLSAEKNTRKIMVLISDGETDLPQGKERTEEQSNQELEQCVCQCQEEGIQIYTVAFGQYDGSKTVLEEIAMQTEAESYSAQGPEDLIEILYGIFQDNLIYQIQKFSSGTYAGGSQEIRCVLDALYLDEINIVLISSKPIGEATVQYGGEEILLTGLSHYAVGKIENVGENQTGKELIIHSKTEEGQDLQVYVISYRGLTPVLEMTTDAERNQHLEYWVYFKDRNENIIKNTEFYNSFLWKLADDDADMVQEYVNVSEGVLKGSLQFPHSGIYMLRGTLSDDFGNYSFSAQVKVINEIPNGSIPEEDCTVLDGERILNLDEFFTDPNGDILTYSVTGVQEGVEVGLEGNLLKILHKPRPELERLTEEKKQYHFCGKLDAYFVLQPEDEEEIPPLSFSMNKVKDGRVSLGALFGTYPEQAKALQLEDIFLIADENRNIILYHRSKSGVMVGNAIACMQIQYSISFGDIIYITSSDGRYDLEIHYVAVFE